MHKESRHTLDRHEEKSSALRRLEKKEKPGIQRVKMRRKPKPPPRGKKNQNQRRKEMIVLKGKNNKEAS